MGWAGTDRLTALPDYFFPAAIRCDPYGAIAKRTPVMLDWRLKRIRHRSAAEQDRFRLRLADRRQQHQRDRRQRQIRQRPGEDDREILSQPARPIPELHHAAEQIEIDPQRRYPEAPRHLCMRQFVQ
jgi:hypothetical protein